MGESKEGIIGLMDGEKVVRLIKELELLIDLKNINPAFTQSCYNL